MDKLIRIPEDLHRALRMHAAQAGTTLRDAATDAVKRYLHQPKKVKK